MRKLIEVIFIVFMCTFLISVLAMTLQVVGDDSPNKAAIIGGLLSMIGGATGALGAYIVATMQVRKQFKKQDMDRVIELRVDKLNDSLDIANKLLHELQLWYGKTISIDMKIRDSVEKKHTYINPNILDADELLELQDTAIRLVSLKDTLKKNKIFLIELGDLEEIYSSTSIVVESNKRFINLFEDFKTKQTIELIKLKPKLQEVMGEVSGSYVDLDRDTRNMINMIENRIKDLIGLD